MLRDVSLRLARGGIAALVDPNGSGKSTLRKALARLIAPRGGEALIDGRAIHALPTAEVARRLGVLPQPPSAPATLTVRELVGQGRYPHVGALRMLRRQDHEAVRRALALTDLAGRAHRPLDALSGGERQRAWTALALAQDTPILLLDEPTTFLDIGHQIEGLDPVARLHAECGTTVVMVLHDLNQAARYADRLVVMDGGRIRAEGPAEAVLTPALLAEVFRIEANVLTEPRSGRPVFLPHPVTRGRAPAEAP